MMVHGYPILLFGRLPLLANSGFPSLAIKCTGLSAPHGGLLQSLARAFETYRNTDSSYSIQVFNKLLSAFKMVICL
jgi:hypothetical protein